MQVDGDSNVARAKIPEPKTEEMLTLSQAGKLVGRTGQTVGRWVQDGLLPCHMLPSGLRVVPRSAIEKFIGGSNLGAKDG